MAITNIYKKTENEQKQRSNIKPLTKEITTEQIAAEFTAKPYLLEFMKKIVAAELEPAQSSYLTAFVSGLQQNQ